MFRPATFPPELAYGAVGGPEFATDVFTATAGWEQRRGRFPQNRGRWTVSLVGRTGPQISLLLHFFRCVAVGQAFSFLFRDFTDYQFVTALGPGDGMTQTFQLFKRYAVGSAYFDRILTKPDVPTVRLAINGVATSTFTVDAMTGILTVLTAPTVGATILASGEFDCVVRFASDTLTLRAVDPGPNGIMVFNAESIDLLEVVNEEPEDAPFDVAIFEPWEAPQTYTTAPFLREHWES